MLLYNTKNKLYKILKAHVSRVNAISIDKSGETLARAGEDGFVYTFSLSEGNRIPHKYGSAVRVGVDGFVSHRPFVSTQRRRRNSMPVEDSRGS